MITDTREYEQLAMRTAPGADEIPISPMQKRLLLMALGLCGEAGEIAEMIKKHVFHGHPMDDGKILHLIKELGDVQWYTTYGAKECAGVGLSNVFHKNIEKLAARYPEGHFSTDRSIYRAEGDV